MSESISATIVPSLTSVTMGVSGSSVSWVHDGGLCSQCLIIHHGSLWIWCLMSHDGSLWIRCLMSHDGSLLDPVSHQSRWVCHYNQRELHYIVNDSVVGKIHFILTHFSVGTYRLSLFLRFFFLVLPSPREEVQQLPSERLPPSWVFHYNQEGIALDCEWFGCWENTFHTYSLQCWDLPFLLLRFGSSVTDSHFHFTTVCVLFVNFVNFVNYGLLSLETDVIIVILALECNFPHSIKWTMLHLSVGKILITTKSKKV